MRGLRHALSMAAALLLTVPDARAEIRIPLYQKIVPLNERTGQIDIYWYLYAKVGEGGEARPYRFDTGSGTFMAGYSPEASPQWWGSFEPTPRTGTTMYGTGAGYKWRAVKAVVTLSDVDGSDLIATPEPVAVGQATELVGRVQEPGAWARHLAAGEPPLQGVMFGNFGAGLYHKLRPGAETPGLYSVLGQLARAGGDRVCGFLLHTGRVTAPEDAHLTLYFESDLAANPDLLAGFQATPAIQLANPDHFPVTGYAVATEFPLRIEAFRVGEVTVNAQAPYGGVIDTGAQSLCMPRDPALQGVVHERLVRPGLPFAVVVPAAEGGTFELGFRTGREFCVNRVFTSRLPEARNFNLGLDLLNTYDIFYDLAGNRLLFRPLK